MYMNMGVIFEIIFEIQLNIYITTKVINDKNR